MGGQQRCPRAKIRLGAAGAFLAAACAAAEQSTPTIQQQMAQLYRQAVAEGRPAVEKASVRPKWGVNHWELVSVHAYAFQPNSNGDLIKDDGNGYRYFAAPTGVPY